MSREVHVPFYERLEVQFPRPTHRFGLSFRDAEDLRRWCADAGRPTRFKPSSPSPTDAVRDGSAKLDHPASPSERLHPPDRPIAGT